MESRESKVEAAGSEDKGQGSEGDGPKSLFVFRSSFFDLRPWALSYRLSTSVALLGAGLGAVLQLFRGAAHFQQWFDELEPELFPQASIAPEWSQEQRRKKRRLQQPVQWKLEHLIAPAVPATAHPEPAVTPLPAGPLFLFPPQHSPIIPQHLTLPPNLRPLGWQHYSHNSTAHGKKRHHLPLRPSVVAPPAMVYTVRSPDRRATRLRDFLTFKA